MKKIFSLIAILIIIAGCDDGDITFKTFNFTDAEVNVCTNTDINTFYKQNETEILELKLAEGSLRNRSTVDPETKNDIPYTIAVGGDAPNKITYKNYNSKVTSYCTSTTAASETWNGTGTLSVITRERRVDGKLKGYSHVITLQNITFSKGDETITINNNAFGSVNKDFNFDFDFSQNDADPIVQKCDETSTFIYTTKSKEVLVLAFNDFNGTFQNTSGTTEIALGAGSDDNTLKFTLYDGTLTRSKICDPDSQAPVTPKSVEQWQATNGNIKIVTTEQSTGEFEHKIYLYDVTFLNTATNDVFILSDVVDTTEDNGYLFGTYITSP
ncbi:hypothetical protein [Flavobacterium sp. NRK1]|uniref:hypothetical protein n=1 Tax=Flavobacterium sp. NRK1 TaxID=2954929 RepID=UPI002092885E|nr:hypothetical protein [Flavobacterium sp. NRK1]MCO6149556.1 hypothetical protein [Flavobacterium sp. NRK1]